MSIRVYLDNTNFILIKATNFDEVEANFKSYTGARDANFYTFNNKKVGPKAQNDLDLEKSKGMLFATDIEYGSTDEVPADAACKDTRNKKLRYEDGIRTDGKSRNKLAQMKMEKSMLEKALRQKLLKDKKIKEQTREDKFNKDNETNRHLDEDTMEILSMKHKLHKYDVDKLNRLEKKFYNSKREKNKIIVM
jgi:hypothetical protein